MTALTLIHSWQQTVTQVIMPSADPLGYPVPPLFLQLLAYLTLAIHLLAMNFTLGGAGLYLWTRVRKGAHADGQARYLGGSLPLGFSYLVTFGIPPLLFVQVMYGQMFYSTSVLLGVFWIMVIPLLIMAYAAFYYHKLTRVSHPGELPWLPIAIGFAGMLAVGFIYVNNLTLTLTPEKWSAIYAADPSGANLNLDEPTLIPRFLLFIVPALAVAGLGLIFRGTVLLRWGLSEEGRASQRFGIKAMVVGLVLELFAGIAVALTLPETVAAQAFSGMPLLLLGAGVILVTVAVTMAGLSLGRSALLFPVASATLLLLGVAFMAAFRDQVRLAYLVSSFSLSDVPVLTQWGMFGIFLATFLVGTVFLIVVLVKVAGNIARRSREELTA